METIEDVLHKDMTRKEFLATLGFGVASLFGIGTMLRFLFGKQHMHTSSRAVTMGYGSSVYGGNK
jgi:hypothetical protein